jgi:hypothetical protein
MLTANSWAEKKPAEIRAAAGGELVEVEFCGALAVRTRDEWTKGLRRGETVLRNRQGLKRDNSGHELGIMARRPTKIQASAMANCIANEVDRKISAAFPKFS